MTHKTVCYVVNHYPKVSHSFIRREILALEAAGFTVERVSVRGWDQPLVDEMDLKEASRTHYVLKKGVVALASQALGEAVRQPARIARALVMALKMALRSDRSIFHHMAYFLEAVDVAALVRAKGAMHIHAHFGTNSTDVALLASLLSGVPYSFTVHGADEVDRAKTLNLPAKVGHARFVVAVSSYGRGQLYRTCDLKDWKKINVVHCGVDDIFLSEPPPVTSYPPRLVCVGRLCNEKAQLLLVEAAARLAAEGRDFEIMLAGDGEMRADVEAAIDRFGLRNKVKITGWIDSDRVKQEIAGSRALVMPSLMEGIPVAIMESLALARPVVTTFVGGIPELVTDGEQGWVVPAGDVPHLADALRRCLDTPAETIARLGAQGRRRVLEQHDASREARKLAALFGREAGPDGCAG